jgi:Uma2 family endonuclease
MARFAMLRATIWPMSRVAERSRMTATDYLAWERAQPTKHEFFEGEAFAMAGGSPRHNALCVNTTTVLRTTLADRGCVTFSSDQRIGLRKKKYVYPDASVVCGKLETEDGADDVVVNPAVIVEVLSSSTEQYDRGGKWEGYRRIRSLTDYLLISQAKPQIELYQRHDDGSWTYRAVGPGERVKLTNGAVLDVDVIFDQVMALPGDEEPGT